MITPNPDYKYFVFRHEILMRRQKILLIINVFQLKVHLNTGSSQNRNSAAAAVELWILIFGINFKIIARKV